MQCRIKAKASMAQERTLTRAKASPGGAMLVLGLGENLEASRRVKAKKESTRAKTKASSRTKEENMVKERTTALAKFAVKQATGEMNFPSMRSDTAFSGTSF